MPEASISIAVRMGAEYGESCNSRRQEMCCVTSYVDSTTLAVLSVVGWSDLTEERATQRHFEEKRVAVVLLKKL
jgi:hypothetical protein